MLPLEPGSTDTASQRIPLVSTLSVSEVPSGAQNSGVWERMEEHLPWRTEEDLNKEGWSSVNPRQSRREQSRRKKASWHQLVTQKPQKVQQHLGTEP